MFIELTSTDKDGTAVFAAVSHIQLIEVDDDECRIHFSTYIVAVTEDILTIFQRIESCPVPTTRNPTYASFRSDLQDFAAELHADNGSGKKFPPDSRNKLKPIGQV